MTTLLSTFTTSFNTENLFVTQFLHFTTALLVDLNVLTYRAAYHGSNLPVYVDAISSSTKQMHSMFNAIDVPICSAHVGSQKMRHVNPVIQRGLQDFLLRLQEYTDVCVAHLRTSTNTI